MTIKAIIKNTIKRLESEGKVLTPDFYAETFCKEAKKAGIKVADCEHLEKFTKTLNKEFQKDLISYRVQSINEFIRFLVSKLNRTNKTQCTDFLEAQSLLVKRILQSMQLLHNKDASALAKKSIDIINTYSQAEQLNQLRQLWMDFLTTYNDSFLDKLKLFGNIDKNDLKHTIEHLSFEKKDEDSVDLSKIASLFVTSLIPSIALGVNEKLAILGQKIKSNPELLDSEEIIKEVKSAVSLRIAMDKESVKEMLGSMDFILDKLSLRLIDMIEKSDSSSVEIQNIKKELENYGAESSKNFKVAHKKLYTIALALEENSDSLNKDLKSNSQEIQKLDNKVKSLEKELEKLKEDSKTDFLTKLYNKRALDEFMKAQEAEFKRYNRNFAVVMFDLDFFKKVNDNYGHEAGDAVLSAFGKILKSESRSVDIVGRFGGEEFLAILSETDTKGGVIFAEKVRKHVQKSRFMYKGKRINVTISSGVAERAKHVSLSAALNSADEYLYIAKKSGRNRVGYKI